MSDVPHQRSEALDLSHEWLADLMADLPYFPPATTDAETQAAYAEFVADILAELPLGSCTHPTTPPIPSSADTRRENSLDTRPVPSEDPHNAWVTPTHVTGADTGPLDDMTVGLKDCIALAGFPLTLGSDLFTGFTPEIDATAVTRLLTAGATIVGKTNMDSFANGGSGELSDFGAVRNPRNPTYLSGGSSSGSAAAVAAGDCTVALGTDQGGSVRIPSAWCGIVGVKPTTGLVPYTGVVPVNGTYDTLGIHARTVAAAAKTLDVIAGRDQQAGVALDPRQPRTVPTNAYTAAIGESIDDCSIGVVEEGFGRSVSDAGVDSTVREAVDVLAAEGATVEEVSIPLHEQAMEILLGAAVQGEAQLLADGLVGTNQTGWYWTQLAEYVEQARAARGFQVPITLKATALAAAALRDLYGVEVYAHARNQALALEQQVMQQVAEYDALVLPTTPCLPHSVQPELSMWERVERAHGMAANTATFSLTHHPAVTVPCGTADGLPVGMMVVGAQFDEATLLRVASAFMAARE